MPGEPQGRAVALLGLDLAQNGHKGLGEGPFGEESAQQIGQPEGHKKGVRLASRPEIGGSQGLPGQSRNTGQ